VCIYPVNDRFIAEIGGMLNELNIAVLMQLLKDDAYAVTVYYVAT